MLSTRICLVGVGCHIGRVQKLLSSIRDQGFDRVEEVPMSIIKLALLTSALLFSCPTFAAYEAEGHSQAYLASYEAEGHMQPQIAFITDVKPEPELLI